MLLQPFPITFTDFEGDLPPLKSPSNAHPSLQNSKNFLQNINTLLVKHSIAYYSIVQTHRLFQISEIKIFQITSGGKKDG